MSEWRELARLVWRYFKLWRRTRRLTWEQARLTAENIRLHRELKESGGHHSLAAHVPADDLSPRVCDENPNHCSTEHNNKNKRERKNNADR